MAPASQTHSTFPPLPGPATSPGAHMPDAPSPVPLQRLSPSPKTASDPSKPVSEELKRKVPWKYEGYAAFSSWMASEDDFFIFRRFSTMNANVILWMQDQIVRKEEQLQNIHKKIEDSPKDHNLRNDSVRWDEQYLRERHEILAELSRLLLHYNQYIDSFSKVRARPLAEPRQITNVNNWLARGAIHDPETKFTTQTGDLISINPRTRPPLGAFLESLPSLHLSRFFRAKPPPSHHTSPATIYSSNVAFEHFTNISIIATGLAMLLAPMWWLEFVEDSRTRLSIITGFVCVFIGIMSVATVNRPFEVVASTAAYAAVLMVFMQIEGNGP